MASSRFGFMKVGLMKNKTLIVVIAAVLKDFLRSYIKSNRVALILYFYNAVVIIVNHFIFNGAPP